MRSRVARAAATALLLAVAGLLAAPRPASAHATLLFTAPAADGAVAASPGRLVLTFDSPVTLAGQPVRLSDEQGRAEATGRVSRSRNGTTLTVPVRGKLAAGVYAVDWQVVADDGDSVTGRYRFVVGPVSGSALATGAGSAPPAAPGTWPTGVFRWLQFAGLAVALGGVAGAWLARRRASRRDAVLPRPWTVAAGAVGLLASAGLALLAAGGGHLLAGLLAPSRWLAGRPGHVAAVEIAAFAVATAAARLRRGTLTVGALVAVAVAEGVRAHPDSAAPGWGVLVTTVHLVAVAVWIGALAYTVRTAHAWRAVPRRAVGLIGDYARGAAWLFALVVVTGTVAAVLLVPLPAIVTTGYGRVLILKILLVGGIAGLAFAARRRLRAGPDGLRRVLRPARVELGGLVAVLAVTGLLTALAPPSLTARGVPNAPPARGPVVPLGGLAGQVGIYGAASAGQLVVRLDAPGDDQNTGSTSTRAPVVVDAPTPRSVTYRMSASLAAPDGRVSRLRLRGCGAGCFVAPVRWVNGTSHVTVRAAATGWSGGDLALAVPWPPRPDAAALRRTVAAMRSVFRFTLYEQVTSDGRTQPKPTRLSLTGRRFLDSEVYGNGAPIVSRVPGRDGAARLLLGFPAERLYADLLVGPDGRIMRETFTDPHHLITRAFVYPVHGD